MEKIYKIVDGGLVEYISPKVEEVANKRAHSLVEACKVLGLGRNTVNDLLLSGRLKGIKVGRKWLVPDWAISEFLRS